MTRETAVPHQLCAKVYVAAGTSQQKRHEIVLAIAELGSRYAIAVMPVASSLDENPDEQYMEEARLET